MQESQRQEHRLRTIVYLGRTCTDTDVASYHESYGMLTEISYLRSGMECRMPSLCFTTSAGSKLCADELHIRVPVRPPSASDAFVLLVYLEFDVRNTLQKTYSSGYTAETCADNKNFQRPTAVDRRVVQLKRGTLLPWSLSRRLLLRNCRTLREGSL